MSIYVGSPNIWSKFCSAVLTKGAYNQVISCKFQTRLNKFNIVSILILCYPITAKGGFFQKVRFVYQISTKNIPKNILNLKFKFQIHNSFLEYFWSDLKIVGTLFVRQSLSTMKRLQRKEELFWTNPLNKQLVAKPFFCAHLAPSWDALRPPFLNIAHKLSLPFKEYFLMISHYSSN